MCWCVCGLLRGFESLGYLHVFALCAGVIISPGFLFNYVYMYLFVTFSGKVARKVKLIFNGVH